MGFIWFSGCWCDTFSFFPSSALTPILPGSSVPSGAVPWARPSRAYCVHSAASPARHRGRRQGGQGEGREARRHCRIPHQTRTEVRLIHASSVYDGQYWRIPVLCLSLFFFLSLSLSLSLSLLVAYNLYLCRTSAKTILTYCTSGVLLRLLSTDELAHGITHIILVSGWQLSD